MGALWSKGNQFEKALEKLDKNISHTEYRQRTAHTNKRKFVAYLIYTAVLVELILITWYYFHKKPIQILDRIIDSYPLVLPPLIGYALSRLVSFYYNRRIKSDGAKLVKLRAQLKQKLEEHKKATDFDATQQLLSKYERLTKDSSPSSPKGVGAPAAPFAAGKKGQQQQAQQQQQQIQQQIQQQQIQQQIQQQQAQQQQQQQQQQQIRQRPVQQQPPPPPAPSAPPLAFTGPATRPAAPPSVSPPPPSSSSSSARPPPPPLPTNRSWLDKLVDYVVGGEPQHSFALICGNCKAHNGLMPQSEMDSFQFRCRFCNYFNESASTTASAPSAPSSSSTSPSAPPSSSAKQPSTSKKDK